LPSSIRPKFTQLSKITSEPDNRTRKAITLKKLDNKFPVNTINQTAESGIYSQSFFSYNPTNGRRESFQIKVIVYLFDAGGEDSIIELNEDVIFFALSHPDFKQIADSDSFESFRQLNEHFESAVDSIESSRCAV